MQSGDGTAVATAAAAVATAALARRVARSPYNRAHKNKTSTRCLDRHRHKYRRSYMCNLRSTRSALSSASRTPRVAVQASMGAGSHPKDPSSGCGREDC